jgi:triosephosphate isomerase (TIM)
LVWEHTRDEIVLCPSFPAIPAVVEAVRGSQIAVGAQDMFWEKDGAYTGEVSAHMLAAAGCTHVIIGHSERRQYFGETDDTVNRKLRAALAAGLKPIVCVGEVLAERDAGVTEDVLRRQCSAAFREIANSEAATIIIAYEPVWAIGTGKTATPELAAEAHRTIRFEAEQAFGAGVATGMRILYGGSVKPENARALMSQAEIDGALVGGASLDPKSFSAIVNW